MRARTSAGEVAASGQLDRRKYGVFRGSWLCPVDPPDPPFAQRFFGSIDLTLPEPEVELKSVEPRNPRVDALGFQFGRQVLVALSKFVSIGSIIIRYDDCVGFDPNIPFQAREVALARSSRPSSQSMEQAACENLRSLPEPSAPSSSAHNEYLITCPCPLPTQGQAAL